MKQSDKKKITPLSRLYLYALDMAYPILIAYLVIKVSGVGVNNKRNLIIYGIPILFFAFEVVFNQTVTKRIFGCITVNINNDIPSWLIIRVPTFLTVNINNDIPSLGKRIARFLIKTLPFSASLVRIILPDILVQAVFFTPITIFAVGVAPAFLHQLFSWPGKPFMLHDWLFNTKTIQTTINKKQNIIAHGTGMITAIACLALLIIPNHIPMRKALSGMKTYRQSVSEHNTKIMQHYHAWRQLAKKGDKNIKKFTIKLIKNKQEDYGYIQIYKIKIKFDSKQFYNNPKRTIKRELGRRYQQLRPYYDEKITKQNNIYFYEYKTQKLLFIPPNSKLPSIQKSKNKFKDLTPATDWNGNNYKVRMYKNKINIQDRQNNSCYIVRFDYSNNADKQKLTCMAVAKNS